MNTRKYFLGFIIALFAFLIPSMIDDAHADTSVSSCGVLDIPGETYVLSDNLISSSGTCLKIAADGITLDGNGHTITGAGSLWGVDVRGTTGVTVKNTNISGFSTGIYVTASDTHIINNTLTNMSSSGIVVSNSCVATITGNTVNSNRTGIEAKYSTGITIKGNNADSNSQDGINVDYVDGVVITGNSALTPGAWGISLAYSNDGFVIENTASGNEAITLLFSNNNTVIKNTIESCSDCNRLYGIGVSGIHIWNSNGNTIIENDVSSTHLWGIKLTGSDNNTLLGNLISNHQKEIASNAWGLLIIDSHDNTFKYNTISNNERPYIIQDSTGNEIYNNNFISNLNEGRVSDDNGSSVFYLDSTIGGNYWDSYDDSIEGCEDLNVDNLCDDPFVSNGYFTANGTIDNFAWTVPDGWLVNSPVIPDIDSLNIPEILHCPGSEPEPTPEPEVPVCEDPKVLDVETNTCVIPIQTETVQAPRDLKAGAIGDLQSLQSSLNDKGKEKMDEAIYYLTESIFGQPGDDKQIWVDGFHLFPDNGDDFFGTQNDAAEKLMEILEKPKEYGASSSVVADIIDIIENKILKADRELAQIAIDEADGGDKKEIKQAKKQMKKADKKIDKEKYAKAIEHYSKAWEHALKATGTL